MSTLMNFCRGEEQACINNKGSMFQGNFNTSIVRNIEICYYKSTNRSQMKGLRKADYDDTIDKDYNSKGDILYFILNRYEEALAAYEQAIRLDPNYATAYNNKGLALDKLRRTKEAQQCYEKARQLGYKG